MAEDEVIDEEMIDLGDDADFDDDIDLEDDDLIANDDVDLNMSSHEIE